MQRTGRESDKDSRNENIVHEARLRDWEFFTTDNKMTSTGLKAIQRTELRARWLTNCILKNAAKWLPGTGLKGI